ncbi:MAG: DUF975 family protein [Lactobacillaceae bacterium]|jgi:uncharacterized membrane protein|nr:DUF975 family protein [Lactobacillaceae bacterium]
MRDNYELKHRARERVHAGQFKTSLLLSLFIILFGYVTVVINQFHNGSSDPIISMWNGTNISVTAAFSTVIGGALLTALLQEVVAGVLDTGAIFRFVEWRRTGETPTTPIADSLRFWRLDRLVDTIVLLGMRFLFTLMWMLLFIIPGIVKSMGYSQATYIFADDLKAGVKIDTMNEYITRSRDLMDGHKMQYFMLNLSFIGWWLLVVLTGGLAGLWVIPYYNASMAEFYIELRRERRYGGRGRGIKIVNSSPEDMDQQ